MSASFAPLHSSAGRPAQLRTHAWRTADGPPMSAQRESCICRARESRACAALCGICDGAQHGAGPPRASQRGDHRTHGQGDGDARAVLGWTAHGRAPAYLQSSDAAPQGRATRLHVLAAASPRLCPPAIAPTYDPSRFSAWGYPTESAPRACGQWRLIDRCAARQQKRMKSQMTVDAVMGTARRPTSPASCAQRPFGSAACGSAPGTRSRPCPRRCTRRTP